jgi:hypothetical protein
MRHRGDDRVCSRCGLRKPLTEQFWYFKQSGPRRGDVTGYCRRCQNAYCRAHDKEIVCPEQLARRRLQQRDWMRRKENYNPDHYRVSVYEAMLAGAPTPRPAAS